MYQLITKTINYSLCKLLKFDLTFWCGNFAEMHSFHKILKLGEITVFYAVIENKLLFWLKIIIGMEHNKRIKVFHRIDNLKLLEYFNKKILESVHGTFFMNMANIHLLNSIKLVFRWLLDICRQFLLPRQAAQRRI